MSANQNPGQNLDHNIHQNPGCLGFLGRLLESLLPPQSDEKAAPSFPYRVRDDFLSPAELSFYHALSTAVREQALICPKVGLTDILFVIERQKNQSAFNRIAQKHVDFLLCDPSTLKPLLGIELDDTSHARSDRQARDAFVDQAFAAANLPLLRIPVQRSYSIPHLFSQVTPYLQSESILKKPPSLLLVETAIQDQPVGNTKEPPVCPKCGEPMVLRTAARGERLGQQFYGCPNYPRCRETIPVTQ